MTKMEEMVAIKLSRQFLGTLSSRGLIESEYTVELDSSRAPTLDGFFLLVGVIPIDSVEFVYFTIRVGGV